MRLGKRCTLGSAELIKTTEAHEPPGRWLLEEDPLLSLVALRIAHCDTEPHAIITVVRHRDVGHILDSGQLDATHPSHHLLLLRNRRHWHFFASAKHVLISACEQHELLQVEVRLLSQSDRWPLWRRRVNGGHGRRRVGVGADHHATGVNGRHLHHVCRIAFGSLVRLATHHGTRVVDHPLQLLVVEGTAAIVAPAHSREGFTPFDRRRHRRKLANRMDTLHLQTRNVCRTDAWDLVDRIIGGHLRLRLAPLGPHAPNLYDELLRPELVHLVILRRFDRGDAHGEASIVLARRLEDAQRGPTRVATGIDNGVAFATDEFTRILGTLLLGAASPVS
mmetsp:Transcript_4111/g.9308  ORF Transcript_4111/g.9308 Transcript_4111/m.9308 type:complete len:335 (-) Transcript_4111:521-1525(-)